MVSSLDSEVSGLGLCPWESKNTPSRKWDKLHLDEPLGSYVDTLPCISEAQKGTYPFQVVPVDPEISMEVILFVCLAGQPSKQRFG